MSALATYEGNPRQAINCDDRALWRVPFARDVGLKPGSILPHWEQIEHVPGSTLPTQTDKDSAECTSLSHLAPMHGQMIEARST